MRRRGYLYRRRQLQQEYCQQLFQPLLQEMNSLSRRVALKESKSGKLRAIVQDVPELAVGIEILRGLAERVLEPLPAG